MSSSIYTAATPGTRGTLSKLHLSTPAGERQDSSAASSAASGLGAGGSWWGRVARWLPVLTRPRAAQVGLAEGYALSARQRRAKGDLAGAKLDEQCAQAKLS